MAKAKMHPWAYLYIPACAVLMAHMFWSWPVFASGTEAYERAMAMEQSGQLDDAIAAIQEAMDAEPGNDLYLATAGHLKYNRGRYADAVRHASHAITINPVGWYYVVAARAAFAMGNFPESRVYARQAHAFGKAALGEANYSTVEDILYQPQPYRIMLSWQIPSKRVIREEGGYSVTVAVPPEKLPYQETDIQISGAFVARDYVKDGNRLLDLIAASPDQVELVMQFSRKPVDYSQTLLQRAKGNAVPEDTRPYLGSSHKIELNSPLLKSIAAAQKGQTPTDTVRNILQWMNENLQYVVSDFAQAEDVVRRGYGECWGWSSVFAALSRLNGIPARNVWGMTNAPGFAPEGHLKGHTWVEFYLAGTGWIPVEPQFPGTLGTLPSHYLRVAHSTPADGWGAVMNLPDTTQILERHRSEPSAQTKTLTRGLK